MADKIDSKICVLKLDRGQDWDSKLLRVRVNWTLKIVVAPGIYAEDVRVFTEFPADGALYARGKFRELKWMHKGSHACTDPDRYIQLKLTAAGPFKLQWTFGPDCKTGPIQGHGYLVVDPDLGYSPDSISCQTVITKQLGPLKQWRSRLEVSYNSGYNMIHFTPPQQLGSSRSAYSISNQLRVDSTYFPTGHTHKEVQVVYTNRGGVQKNLKIDSGFLDIRKELQHLKHQLGILTLVDVVWNHTAFDTPWLIQHPEAGYNLVNSTHLRPAYALDVVLAQYSKEIVNGDWEHMGVHPRIGSEHDIHMICSRLKDTVLPRAKLWEYFSVDVEAIVKEFKTTVCHLNGGEHAPPEGRSLSIIQDPQYRRLGSTVDASLTLELFNIFQPETVCFEERIDKCCTQLRSKLRSLNEGVEHRVRHQLHQAVDNMAANMRYEFLEHHGPKRTTLTHSEPFTLRYFVLVGGGVDLSWSDIEGPKGKNVLVHNGWVMNADPLVNFASEGSQVYFQRELIVWADSVKLRFGNSPADSPWLWDHMTRYTQTMAWLFDGFRLDNCHNTPLNVAEGLLDSAREVNPNLYLVAELFTPSEERDNYYVNRLGINSLIREAMFAHNPRELGRLVYKYGGVPVASFFSGSVLKPSTAHAMFIDATHDNDPGHILSRSVQDALPNTALVSIASCASGGCRGYDELVPHKIDVVTEKRLYSSWCVGTSPSAPGVGVTKDSGIIGAKLVLNTLHRDLAEKGYNEIFVDQVTEELVAVTRHCPATHQSMIMMAHTAFRPPAHWATPTTAKPNIGYSDVPPLYVQGRIKEIYFEGFTVAKDPPTPQFTMATGSINGLDSHVTQCHTHIRLGASSMCKLLSENNSSQEVGFGNFPPGSVIVFEVELMKEARDSVGVLRSFLEREKSSAEGCGLWTQIKTIASSLTLTDLNYVLYRCDNEEKDEGKGSGVYVVPGAGPLVYCGLQGIVSMLEPIRDNNDLGHSLCDNLRSGDWLPGYTANRLKQRDSTRRLGDALSLLFHHLSNLPRYLIPCYFEALVSKVHQLMVQTVTSKFNKFIQQGSSLLTDLALGSVQIFGDCHSAHLPPPLPSVEPSASLAAGLPHFSTGFMRCWGRDTFIALRGLLLVTGRYKEAEQTILAFGACLRHGLIPNLLSEGRNPRYNCRDAIWWWLQSIQDYYTMAGSKSILTKQVRRLFPFDVSEAEFDGHTVVTLAQLVQEALQCHAHGIKFTERGAGSGLDRDMKIYGFNVEVGVDWATGFVQGGNEHNCGTWMDKVGESAWARNKGVPATPRDGSPVELVGLSYSAISWLSSLHDKGQYQFNGVYTTGDRSPGAPFITFKDWKKKLEDNFEHKFYIPLSVEEGNTKEGGSAGYIHRRGIYKDTVGSTHIFTDYQLRPNFPIAMAIAPKLFTPANALIALKQTEEILLGPLGMRTLDPLDLQYNGYYINSVDSEDFKTSRGFNYHQGPEWLWPVGYFMRAKLNFMAHDSVKDRHATPTYIHKLLSRHAHALRSSPWQGLPELTNQNGANCGDSCPVQAWSMATLLDTLYDMDTASH